MIAVDLDGTLAEYHGWSDNIGKPIKPMMDRVKKWLSDGKKVKIFTARADNQEQIDIIKKWLKEQGLEELEVTNIKESGFEEFWDDKAIQVIKNTGVLACDYNNLK